jgi:hypothetical protein
MKQLPLPDGATEDASSIEMARIWIAGDDLLVSLNVGCFIDQEGPGETTAWGDIVADTIKQLSRAISQRLDMSPLKAQQEILARCTEALVAYGRDVSGQIK